tara:strand:- start:990 stop:1118 length:129 start_codon:yes stop_codon:yes gene_type:complete
MVSEFEALPSKEVWELGSYYFGPEKRPDEKALYIKNDAGKKR